MPLQPRSSRRRYEQYLKEFKARGKAPKESPAQAEAAERPGRRRAKLPRTRPVGVLLKEYWRLIEGHRGILTVALVALAIATAVHLIPLYGSKVVFDSVIREHPLPNG